MTSAYLIVAGAALAGLIVVAVAALKGWRDWLALKGRELDRQPREIEHGSAAGMARIELSDLKERIRKLEAIADGII
ncbi:MAG: hypothetical protein QM676_07965 [Novosphingobium sp.]